MSNMQDAGIAILESFDAEIYLNTFEDVKYGMRISLGGGNNYVHHNEFKKCSKCEKVVVVTPSAVSGGRHLTLCHGSCDVGHSWSCTSRLDVVT